MQYVDWLEPVIEIAVGAGAKILDVYNSDFDVEHKADESPLTAADLAAHKFIVAGLEALTPDIPVLSEESASIEWEERKHWNPYWLVDPLDGTKEFVKRNGEFTVNIALIRQHKPVLGVVHVPVTNVTYCGEENAGAMIIENRDPCSDYPSAALAIGTLVVAPGARKKGFGIRLVEFAKALAFKQNKRLFVESFFKYRKLDFYTRLGFARAPFKKYNELPYHVFFLDPGTLITKSFG